MDEVTVVTEVELEEPEGTSNVSRQVPFDTEEGLMIRSRVAGEVTTGDESVALDAVDFIYVPPRTIRRESTDEDWEILITFDGSGPPAVSVDDSEPVNL